MKDILTSILNTPSIKTLTQYFDPNTPSDQTSSIKRNPHVSQWTTIQPSREQELDILGITHLVRLRNAVADDMSGIVALESICYGGYLAWEQRDFEQDFVKNPYAVYWVIENLTPSAYGMVGQIIGLISGRFQHKSAHISHLFILPSFREHGLAQQLLNLWLIQAQQAGIPQASLEVRASNQAAQALYQKLGFQYTGEKARYYYNNDETAYLMTAYLKEVK